MSIASTLSEFLSSHEVVYDVVAHPMTQTSSQTAQRAHLPGNQVAKAVVLEDGETFLLAVIPTSHRLDPAAMWDLLGRRVRMVEEGDFRFLFRDCRTGAVPAVGQAYGVLTVVDRALLDEPEIYFEAGDHEHLIHVGRGDFAKVMSGATLAEISYHA